MLRAYTALIPKDSTLEDPLPTEFRSISVLSGIYRLWSKARFVSAMKWQEGWVTDSVFGCRRKRSSEQLAMQIASIWKHRMVGLLAWVAFRMI